jgi:hypothetical protein
MRPPSRRQRPTRPSGSTDLIPDVADHPPDQRKHQIYPQGRAMNARLLGSPPLRAAQTPGMPGLAAGWAIRSLIVDRSQRRWSGERAPILGPPLRGFTFTGLACDQRECGLTRWCRWALFRSLWRVMPLGRDPGAEHWVRVAPVVSSGNSRVRLVWPWGGRFGLVVNRTCAGFLGLTAASEKSP